MLFSCFFKANHSLFPNGYSKEPALDSISFFPKHHRTIVLINNHYAQHTGACHTGYQIVSEKRQETIFLASFELF